MVNECTKKGFFWGEGRFIEGGWKILQGIDFNNWWQRMMVSVGTKQERSYIGVMNEATMRRREEL